MGQTEAADLFLTKLVCMSCLLRGLRPILRPMYLCGFVGDLPLTMFSRFPPYALKPVSWPSVAYFSIFGDSGALRGVVVAATWRVSRGLHGQAWGLSEFGGLRVAARPAGALAVAPPTGISVFEISGLGILSGENCSLGPNSTNFAAKSAKLAELLRES